MSEAFPDRPAQDARKCRFAIVASRYNHEFVQGMASHAKEELAAIHTNAEITMHEVPGAYEIPVAVQEIAMAGNVDAVIALGVIIQGATMHAELIGRSVTEALQQLALKYRTPVIHEVLLLKNEAQARERCLDAKINRGTEAARSASHIATVIRELKAGR